ncbi:MAG: hypothetical protein PHQ35_08140 [Phycisphaerae bacterium]|nr:hypothetical protein [Phycisphaerae bacterium]
MWYFSAEIGGKEKARRGLAASRKLAAITLVEMAYAALKLTFQTSNTSD